MKRVRGLLLGYLVVALLSGWPIASVVIAGTIASVNGCTLNEGSVHPCIVSGRDIGGTLYSMGVAGWFMIVTIPLGVMGFLAWTAAWLLWALWRRKLSPRGLRE